MGVFEYGYDDFLDGPVISCISVGIRNKILILLLMSNIDSVILRDSPVILCISVSFRTRISILCVLV